MAFQFNPSDYPLVTGVYIFRDGRNKPLYVGKAVSLRTRLSSYFQEEISLLPKTALIVSQVAKIATIATETELEALLLEVDLIKRLKPKYNLQWKDDKRYQYIKVSSKVKSPSQRLVRLWRKKSKLEKQNKTWPYVTTARKKDDSDTIYLGPFPEGRTVNQVLRALRRVFPWCKYKSEAAAKRAKADKRGCFYYQIGLCPGICAGKIKLEEYQEIMANLVRVLSGNSKEVVNQWQKSMKQAAGNRNFEEAAKYRDLIQKLNYVTQSFRNSSEYLENPNLLSDQRQQEIEELVKVLQAYFSSFQPPTSSLQIEAYDVSNIQGEYATGAKVSFVGGEPQKSEYRRYKIRLDKKELPNDVAALQEVLIRRFKPVTAVKGADSEGLPHLLLIDGGKGQVSAALGALEEFDIEIPVVGLAKKQEEIVVPQRTEGGNLRYEILQLSKGSPALKLLQRIRDEVHRFAISYHRKLRHKAMIGS